MRNNVIILSSLLILFLVPTSFAMSDKEIQNHLIKESIQSYPGNCPCPYNTTRNGSRCGGRSAYSKPGGYSPVCYPKDVTPEMIRQYRKTHP